MIKLGIVHVFEGVDREISTGIRTKLVFLINYKFEYYIQSEYPPQCFISYQIFLAFIYFTLVKLKKNVLELYCSFLPLY